MLAGSALLLLLLLLVYPTSAEYVTLLIVLPTQSSATPQDCALGQPRLAVEVPANTCVGIPLSSVWRVVLPHRTTCQTRGAASWQQFASLDDCLNISVGPLTPPDAVLHLDNRCQRLADGTVLQARCHTQPRRPPCPVSPSVSPLPARALDGPSVGPPPPPQHQQQRHRGNAGAFVYWTLGVSAILVAGLGFRRRHLLYKLRARVLRDAWTGIEQARLLWRDLGAQQSRPTP